MGLGHHRPRSGGGGRALLPRLLLSRVFYNFGEPRMLRTHSYNRAGNGATCSLRHIDPDVPPAVVLRSPHRIRRHPSGPRRRSCLSVFQHHAPDEPHVHRQRRPGRHVLGRRAWSRWTARKGGAGRGTSRSWHGDAGWGLSRSLRSRMASDWRSSGTVELDVDVKMYPEGRHSDTDIPHHMILEKVKIMKKLQKVKIVDEKGENLPTFSTSIRW
jgi:hypothetical protein